eukprot:1156235-Pelagomonas_calceolata.AAC.17
MSAVASVSPHAFVQVQHYPHPSMLACEHCLPCNRPLLTLCAQGGSFSSGESGSDDDDDFYQDLSEGGFDELARSPVGHPLLPLAVLA